MPAPRSEVAQCGGEMGETLQIVYRAQLVDVRAHGPGALGLRLVAGKAQQRVEPDEAPAGLVQALHILLRPPRPWHKRR